MPRLLRALSLTLLLPVACIPQSRMSHSPQPIEPAGSILLGAAEAEVPPVEETVPAPVEAIRLPDADSRARGLEALRGARSISRGGRYQEALRLYDDVGRSVPVFGDWALVLAADAAREAKDIGEVARRVEAIVPGSSAAEWGWRIQVQALREANDAHGALTVATQAARTARAAAAISAAWAEAGDIRLKRGDVSGAIADFRSALQVAPETAGGLRAARAAYDLPGLAAEDHLLIGRALLRHGGTDRGIAALERYLSTGHGSAEARAAVQLEAGRVLFNARRFADAGRHLNAAAAFESEASFLAGRAAFRAGRRDEGMERFRATAQRFPRTAAAADALSTLGDLAYDNDQSATAREHYRSAIATGVHTQAASDAAVRAATISLRQGNVRAAVADLEAYLGARPKDRVSAPALYWAGRAYHAADDRDAAARHFRQALEADPYTYYGVRAAEQIGSSLRDVALRPAPAVPTEVRNEIDAAFFRIDLLKDLGLDDAADFEMARLRGALQGNPAALAAVAEGMIPRGQPIAAALLARRVQLDSGEWTEQLLRLVYQFPYRDLIVREARRNGLDPFVVAGLIRQESLFNPIAISPAGAIGLMQVMPETGRGLARRVGISNYRPDMLREPELNVRLGTLFLADQMRRWNGHKPDVFAAYNAGPGRVVRWRNFPEHGDEDLYAERIPFSETRDYVKKLRANAQIYRLLYADN